MLHTAQLTFEDMHEFPCSTQELYLLKPEVFKFGFGDMSYIERTFIGENKQFWAEVAKANFMQWVRSRELLIRIRGYIKEQNEPAAQSQVDALKECKDKMLTAFTCFKIANKRRKSGFGLVRNESKDAVKLRAFYTGLFSFISNTQENIAFKNSIIEQALSFYLKRQYQEHHECDGVGFDNHNTIRRIIADINCSDERELFTMMLLTQDMAEKLAKLSNGQYLVPVYQRLDAA
jgi:hypothetical protein